MRRTLSILNIIFTLAIITLQGGRNKDKEIKKETFRLHRAIINNNNSKVQKVICRGLININAPDTCSYNDGFTPITRAIWYNRNKILQLLLGLPDIDVNAQETNGFTPIHRAVWKNNTTLLQLLVAQGCQLDAKDSKQKSTPRGGGFGNP